MTSRIIAASRTDRVMGPSVSVLGRAGNIPKRLTSGTVGRTPTRLFTAAGPRVEPPVSSPIAAVAKFAATADPLPPDDPLAIRVGSYALRTTPKAEPRYPDANSPIVVLPSMTAPASFSRLTTVAFRPGT